MIGCDKLIYKIFGILVVYLLAINIILWTLSPDVSSALQDSSYLQLSYPNTFLWWHQHGMSEYKGFRWFYQEISTFPGPTYTIGVITNWSNIISGYNVTNNGIVDFILAIFRLFSAPLLLAVTIVVDLLNNLVWFIHFIGRNNYFVFDN